MLLIIQRCHLNNQTTAISQAVKHAELTLLIAIYLFLGWMLGSALAGFYELIPADADNCRR